MNKVTIVLLILFLTACEKSPPPAASNESKKEIEDLQSLVQKLQERVSSLEQSERKQRFEEAINKNDSAYLQTGDTNFSTINTFIGILTFSIVNIEPYASGSRVELNIGNPLNSALKNVKFKVDYGSLDKDGVIVDGSEKTKEIRINETIQPGAWNKTKLILDGIETGKLGYIKIYEFTAPTLSMSQR